MTSYLPSFSSFSSSSSHLGQVTTLPNLDDPHLEVTVTPSASAFYAGETFSATITFRNTRTPHNAHHAHTPDTPTTVPPTAETAAPRPALPGLEPRGPPTTDLPKRRGVIGRGIDTQVAEARAGPSRSPVPALNIVRTPLSSQSEFPYPYSPGADRTNRAAAWHASPERDVPGSVRSPDVYGQRQERGLGKDLGHARRTRSLALGTGKGSGMSPQEMVWALGGQPAPPPLPSRRPPSGASIPSSHPHSRKISIASQIASPPPAIPVPLPPPDSLAAIPEGPNTSPTAPSAGPSRPPSRTTDASGSSRSIIDLNRDEDSRTSSDLAAPTPRRPRLSPSISSTLPSRTPSYPDTFSPSPVPLPPPSHPYVRQQEPRGITTLLWSHTRLVAHFHPSTAYIPPDPLLPLRSLLLHQPVGSGTLSSPSSSSDGLTSSNSSRWQLSFGTGTIGNATQPSLTGSLFGLAKGLVSGGHGGSLEEERKRVWNMKDLPVFETARSLLGVDLRLKEGESREFTYSLQLPAALPPAHRGRAFRFSYDLVVSLNVSLPGKRQRTKEIHLPIRVWANVSLTHPVRTYDVLQPIIQTGETADVHEVSSGTAGQASSAAATEKRRRSSVFDRNKDTADSLQSYATHLIETITPPGSTSESPRLPPLSPSRVRPVLPSVVPGLGITLDVPDSGNGKASKARKGSFVRGDDELLEEGAEDGGCGEAVEVLSRHSPKTSYDIAKDGVMVGVLTLIKQTYRLGETILGVVEFNDPEAERHVLKFSAFLESHELIPESLLPLSASSAGRTKQPPLFRLHAEYRQAYAIHTRRLAFSLDIPSDATPAFSLAAGQEGFQGGLEWRVRVAFLVGFAPRRSRARASMDRERIHGVKGDGHRGGRPEGGSHVLPHPPTVGDADNRLYSASGTLAPMYPEVTREAGGGEKDRAEWREMKVETVECEVPVRVLAGNTAFVVRPGVFVV